MLISEIIGSIGLIMVLLAFALNLFKKFKIDDVSYNSLNLAGAGFLAYYAMVLASIPFLILQLTWAFFSLYKLTFKLINK